MAPKFHADDFRMEGGEKIAIREHYSPDFPRLLYRANGLKRPSDADGSQAFERNLVRGFSVDTLTVFNMGQQDTAIVDGWFLTPEETEQDMASDPVAEGEVRRGPGRPRRDI